MGRVEESAPAGATSGPGGEWVSLRSAPMPYEAHEKAPQRAFRSGRIFPIVRSGRACGGLTSVLALGPCIFFVDRRMPRSTLRLLSVKLSRALVYDEPSKPFAVAATALRLL